MENGSTNVGNLLIETIAALYGWATSLWEVSLFISLFAFFRWWWASNYREEKSRVGIINFLNHAQATNVYKLLIGWLLGTVDRWGLTPEELARRPATRPAWTGGLYARCLVLSLVYSTLAVYATWPFIDAPIRFGSERYLVAAQDIGRVWTIFALGSCIVWAVATLRAGRSSALAARVGWWGLAVLAATLAASAQMLSVRISGYGAGASILLVAVATSVTLDRRPAIQGTAALAAVIAATGVLKLIEPGSAPSGLAQALRWILGAAGLGDLPGGVDGRLLRSGIQEAMVSAACTWLAVRVLQRSVGDGDMSARQHAVAWIGVAGLALALATFMNWGGYIPQLRLIVLLPLINAAFDLASLGLTRWALRRGVRRVGWRTFGWSTIDLVAALGLLLALGCTLILVLGLFDIAVGFPMTDVPKAFASWRAEPQSHLWLALAIGSTLVPTLVHVMVAVWAIGPALLNRRARHWMAQTLAGANEHFGWRWLVLTILSAWSALSVTAPIIMLAWFTNLIAVEHLKIAAAIIDFFETLSMNMPGARG